MAILLVRQISCGQGQGLDINQNMQHATREWSQIGWGKGDWVLRKVSGDARAKKAVLLRICK